ncbi:helix-turn-helix domain-containing protein [Sporomusa aerivorans]|uniref:helix-turn-helix domain-containing protein n=1 Tax=Sporomusa aerivorans TaxID=204936 RepID=UPI00352A5DE4
MKQTGKSQRWLARDTGIALPTINALVRGTKTMLTIEQEEKLAKSLGVNPKELYYQGRN